MNDSLWTIPLTRHGEPRRALWSHSEATQFAVAATNRSALSSDENRSQNEVK